MAVELTIPSEGGLPLPPLMLSLGLCSCVSLAGCLSSCPMPLRLIALRCLGEGWSYPSSSCQLPPPCWALLWRQELSAKSRVGRCPRPQ